MWIGKKKWRYKKVKVENTSATLDADEQISYDNTVFNGVIKPVAMLVKSDGIFVYRVRVSGLKVLQVHQTIFPLYCRDFITNITRQSVRGMIMLCKKIYEKFLPSTHGPPMCVQSSQHRWLFSLVDLLIGALINVQRAHRGLARGTLYCPRGATQTPSLLPHVLYTSSKLISVT